MPSFSAPAPLRRPEWFASGLRWNCVFALLIPACRAPANIGLSLLGSSEAHESVGLKMPDMRADTDSADTIKACEDYPHGDRREGIEGI